MKKILLLITLAFLSLLLGCEVITITKETTYMQTSSTTTETITSEFTTSELTTESTVTEEITTKKSLEGDSLAVGIWHRPNVMGNETNLKGIEDTLDTFKKCGINIVYLETIYHGMAMYKSNLLPYYTGFDSCDYSPYTDYLKAFIGEAEKRNIEVHAWVEDFYIGITKGKLAESHPDWLLLTCSGKDIQSEGNGYIFLDPANKSVTDFLINLYYEMLNKNIGIKGINLDYIRYPVSSKTDDTGYTTATKKGLLDKYLISYTDDTLDAVFDKFIKNNYQVFTDYRAEKVTSFVESIRKMVDTYFKGIILSTAVFPDSSEAYELKKQDFKTWITNGYLDVVTPMAYYDDISTFNSYLKDMVKNANGIYCYTGVSCFYHNLSVSEVNKQIDSSINLSNGFVIFGSQKLLSNQTYINELNKRFGNQVYHLPHLD